MGIPAVGQEQTFGQRVRTLRKAAGLNARQFAGQVQISPQYLSDLERGNRPPPPVGCLGVWAGILHVGVAVLEESALMGRVDGTAVGRILRERDALRAEVARLRTLCAAVGLRLMWRVPVAEEAAIAAAD